LRGINYLSFYLPVVLVSFIKRPKKCVISAIREAVILLIFFGCSQSAVKDQLFTEVSQVVSIDFSNDIHPTEEFNPYTFRSFYNGGGVAIGDVDNNGYQDIYFTGNQVDNQLYLNFGNWTFKEAAAEAGVDCKGVWSTGATFADINADGFPDLHVCKSGAPGGKNRSNSLFINNGDGTFTDKAGEYGLDVEGLSVQAAFFDFDKDGDLDCYLLTNSFRSVGTGADLKKNSRNISDSGGNKLFRNDNGYFRDISEQAGIYTSAIGFGLGITLGDFNYDLWPDIFISNDFFEKDYLYINNTDGTFTEKGEVYFNSMSLGSMGADVADLNNDGLLDLLVTEMLPERLKRKKTKALYESWNKYQLSVSNGYYHQFPRNMLHIGSENDAFFEAGRISGLTNTDWSWGSLLFDMNNDGLKDAFISNGIFKDLLDRDFLSFTANEANIRKLVQESDDAILKLLEEMPSEPLVNSAFRNQGDLKFEKVSYKWGFSEPTFSNGSAYADLDNDNDLDLIINNVNQRSFVYRNNTSKKAISFKLEDARGGSGIGAKVSVRSNGNSWFRENFPVKGYQSSSTPIIHFGVDTISILDTVEILWPSGKRNILTNLKTDELLIVSEDDATNLSDNTNRTISNSYLVRSKMDLNFIHKENDFVDFDRNNLLPEMYSNLGSRVASSDLNKDGITDFYLGGSKNQPGVLFVSEGLNYQKIFCEGEAICEDMDAVFFDADGDNDLDLYVASGGTEYSSSSTALIDRVYLNNNGEFKIAKRAVPLTFKISSSFVSPGDFDEDGDIDLLVGERFNPTNYGINGGLHLLMNNGEAVFSISKRHSFPEIKTSELITDGQFTDIDNDGDMDVVAVGEWSRVHVFINEEDSFKYASPDLGLNETTGWWNTVEVSDLNKDGLKDLIIGNKGINTFFKTGTRLYTSDFDRNGFIDNILSVKEDGSYYPIHDRDELIGHFPVLKKGGIYYSEYATKTIEELFGKELLDKSIISEIDISESSVFYQSESSFERVSLPTLAQLSPIYAIEVIDLNKDGILDLIIGGNQYNVKPQFGRYDALNATVLLGSKEGITNDRIKMTDIEGQVRDIEYFFNNGEKVLFFINNDSLQIRSLN